MSSRLSRAIDKIGAQLAPLFDEKEFDLAKETLVQGCLATRRVRAGKDPATGAYRYDDEPDYTIRFASAVKVIEWCAGKPVTRSITANVTTPGDSSDAEKFYASFASDPAALDTMEDTIKKIRAAHEKAKPVEVTATPVVTEKPQSSA